jgi:uncharacterized membrane protein (DUF4010 family)
MSFTMNTDQYSGLTPEMITSFEELLIVLGIGLLLGIEREFSKSKPDSERVKLFAGVRTFPIVALAGYAGALLAEAFSVWILVATFAGVLAMIALSYQGSRGKDLGTTTEFSLMMTFILGALVFIGKYHLSVTIAVLVTALLTLKIRMHEVIKRLSREDILAILLFVVITALVLPLLPDEDFGPYAVFNPYKVWLIVVIFVTLNFLSYFLSKFLDEKRSTLTIGILGGFASSTATAWYFSRRTGKSASASRLAAAAIVLASSIMFFRLLIWLVILNLPLFRILWLPVSFFGIIGLAAGYWLSREEAPKGEGQEMPAGTTNPINLREALFFGLIYLLIQLLVGYADEQYGASGAYVASGISGITDIDAITISMAELAKGAGKEAIAATAIIIAAFSNTLIKYTFCLVFGNASLRRYASLVFVPLFLMGIAYVVFRILG